MQKPGMVRLGTKLGSVHMHCDVSIFLYCLKIELIKIRLAFHKYAAEDVGESLLGGAGEEDLWTGAGR